LLTGSSVLLDIGNMPRPREHRYPSLDPADLTATVGANLRRLRDARGLSLVGLARRSGVSRSMLNQIELGRSAPTINVLFRISQALEQPFSALLDDARPPGPRIWRAKEIQTVSSRDGHFVSRALFTFEKGGKAEVYELRLAVGGVRHAMAHAKGTSESLAILHGRLDLTIGAQEHLLHPGDAIRFDADVEHTYRNRGRTELVMFLVMSYSTP
jgi:transcriptional regulator with XRE-family HTH domain